MEYLIKVGGERMQDFGIIVYRDDTENYIILAEGTIESLSEIYDTMKEISNNPDKIIIVKLDKSEYDSKKKVLMLLNQYIEANIAQ